MVEDKQRAGDQSSLRIFIKMLSGVLLMLMGTAACSSTRARSADHSLHQGAVSHLEAQDLLQLAQTDMERTGVYRDTLLNGLRNADAAREAALGAWFTAQSRFEVQEAKQRRKRLTIAERNFWKTADRAERLFCLLAGIAAVLDSHLDTLGNVTNGEASLSDRQHVVIEKDLKRVGRDLERAEAMLQPIKSQWLERNRQPEVIVAEE